MLHSNSFPSISGNCPEGYESDSRELGGAYPDQKWTIPYPGSLQGCADVCNNREGCTSFAYANGPKKHGACGTYTGGDSNLGKEAGRKRADSDWFSCIKKGDVFKLHFQRRFWMLRLEEI